MCVDFNSKSEWIIYSLESVQSQFPSQSLKAAIIVRDLTKFHYNQKSCLQWISYLCAQDIIKHVYDWLHYSPQQKHVENRNIWLDPI